MKMYKIVTISLDEEYERKLSIIAKREYRKKSAIIRKWIDENYKEEYDHE